jgi:hypothetical protein
VYGGGVSATYDARPEVVGNTFDGNQATHGGAVYSHDGGLYRGNRMTNNTAGNGGGICFGDIAGEFGAPLSFSALVQDNDIEGNTAGWGGGLLIWHCSATVRMNRIRANNVGGGVGGGVFIEHGASLLERNTITGNITGYEAAGVYCCGDTTELRCNNISENLAAVPHCVGCGVFT